MEEFKTERLNLRLTQENIALLEKIKETFGGNKTSIILQNLDSYIVKTGESEDNEYLLKLNKTKALILETLISGNELNLKQYEDVQERFKKYESYAKQINKAISKKIETSLENYLRKKEEFYKEKLQKDNELAKLLKISYRMEKSYEILEISKEIEDNLRKLMKQYEELTNQLLTGK